MKNKLKLMLLSIMLFFVISDSLAVGEYFCVECTFIQDCWFGNWFCSWKVEDCIDIDCPIEPF